MTVKLDKFGRVLIPKEVREARGLQPGDEFELDAHPACGTGIHLEPKPKHRFVIQEGGLLPVLALVDEAGQPVAVEPEAAWATAVGDAREERVGKLVGKAS